MSLAYQSKLYPVEIEQVIDNLPSAIIVVDSDNRVLLANRMALTFSQKSKEAFFGLRGGEAFGCVNSNKSPEGCGYAPECNFAKSGRLFWRHLKPAKDKSRLKLRWSFHNWARPR